MSASLQKQERQLGVVLFSSHEPVGLDVALPNLPLLVHEFVWTVLSGERASFLKSLNAKPNAAQVAIVFSFIIESFHFKYDCKIPHFEKAGLSPIIGVFVEVLNNK